MATTKPKRPPRAPDPSGGKGTIPPVPPKSGKTPPPKGKFGGGGKPGKMMPGAPAGRGTFGQVTSKTPPGKKPAAGKKPTPGPRKGR